MKRILTAAIAAALVGLTTLGPLVQLAGCAAVPRAALAVDVRTYGATGDGVTDDTAAIQAALTAVSDGDLLFPVGTYKVTTSLTKTISAGKRLRLVGTGGATIVSTMTEPGSEAGILDFQGTGSSHLAIEGLTITHTGIATVGLVDGIRVYNATPAPNSFGDVTLRNVKVTGASLHGIYLLGISSGQVINCQANNNNYAGIQLGGAQNVVIQGGAFNSNGVSGGTGDYGVSLGSQSSYGGNRNVLIQGVTANNNYRKGIDVHDGHTVAIRNNFVKFDSGGSNLTPVGIYAVGESSTKDVRDVKIEGNFVDCVGATGAIVGIHAGPAGATAPEYGTLTIANNTVQNTNLNASALAILVANPTTGGAPLDKAIVAGNTVINGTGTGGARYCIRFDNSAVPAKEVVIANNNVHTVSASGGIAAMECEQAVVVGNTVTIDSGTPTYGIFVDTGAKGIVSGNNISGAATYGTPIQAAGCASRANQVQGAATSDTSILLAAGAATAGKAPLKFTAGTNLTTPESGTVEYDGTRWYLTNSTPSRRTVATQEDANVFTAAQEISKAQSGTFVGLKVAGTASDSYPTIQVDRAVNTRSATFKVSTAATDEWFMGLLYNGGSATTTWGISTDYSLANAKLRIDKTSGRVAIGSSSPTAMLHLPAGAAAASSAPLKLTAGTNLTTPEAGAVEFNGTDLFFTPAATRLTTAFRNIAQTFTGDQTVNGDVILGTAGNGLKIKTGTNARMGRATLVGGTATVATTAVTANSNVILTSQVDGGTPGDLRVSARNAGTDFTITSSSGADTSTVAWVIFEPAP